MALHVAPAERVPGIRPDYLLIADCIPGLIGITGPDGAVESCNRAVLEYYGVTLEAIQGWASSKLVHPDDIPGMIAKQKRSLETGERLLSEIRLLRADGVYRWFQIHGEPLRNSRGEIVQWYVLQTDIDDRKCAESLLAGEKRLLEMVALGRPLHEILNSLCAFVETTVPECQCAVFPIDRREQRFDKGFAPSLGTAYTGPLEGVPVVPASAPCGAAATHQTQVIAFDIESDPRWLASSYREHALAFGLRAVWSTPIVSRSGEVLGTFAVYQRHPGSPTQIQRDLIAQFTHIASIAIERTQSEETLDKLRSDLAHVARVTTLGALTASIAHEVNQPLAGIVTNASTCLRMLAADPPNIEGARETARRTIRDGERASEVITRLRALFSKKTTTTGSIDLNEAVREVVALSMSELQRQGVTVRLELFPDLPPVKGDRVQLQQVILNLLLNASDAMGTVVDRPRDLVIVTASDGADVHLSVSDSGIGFDGGNPEKLFDAFYTTKSDGMGIGLSVSRSIMERHGGRLWATPNDGPGATFWFSIPQVLQARRRTG
jgi:PAS domain S-box-containing protein